MEDAGLFDEDMCESCELGEDECLCDGTEVEGTFIEEGDGDLEG